MILRLFLFAITYLLGSLYLTDISFLSSQKVIKHYLLFEDIVLAIIMYILMFVAIFFSFNHLDSATFTFTNIISLICGSLLEFLIYQIYRKDPTTQRHLRIALHPWLIHWLTQKTR